MCSDIESENKRLHYCINNIEKINYLMPEVKLIVTGERKL